MPELIDRAKLLEYLAAIKPDEYVSAYGEAAVDVITHVETYVNEMPTIEAEPVRRGRWNDHKHTDAAVCSECGRVFIDETPYCPNCGARMDLRTPTEAALDMADSVMMGGAENA